MRSFENGHALHVSNAAGSLWASLRGWAVGFFSFLFGREKPVPKESTLMRVSLWAKGGAVSEREVQLLKGGRLSAPETEAVKDFADRHFVERVEYYRRKGKVLMKLDVDVRFNDGECEFVADRDPYVATEEVVAKASRDQAA